MAKVLTKYIFKESKHYVCFIISVPCLVTLGTFFLVENCKLTCCITYLAHEK